MQKKRPRSLGTARPALAAACVEMRAATNLTRIPTVPVEQTGVIQFDPFAAEPNDAAALHDRHN